METWIRSAIVVISLAVVGFLGDWQASALTSSRGSLGPTILQSLSPISSLMGVLITVAVASLIGGFVGRLTSTTTGMFILGFALFAMALKLEGAEELILSEGSFNLLILEAILLSAIILLGAIIVFGISGPLKCVQKRTSEDRLTIQVGKAVLISLTIIPVIWLIAITPDKAQVIGAAAVGGIVIVVLLRQFLGSMQPLLLFALPTAMGGIGYFIGVTLGGTDPSSFAQQEMSTLLFPMPLDYAAGAIIGLSLGLSWTASTENETAPELA
jgi:hypothetical protein